MAVPIVLIGSESAQPKMGQFMFGDDLEGHHSSRVTEWAPHSAAVLLHVVDHSHEPQAQLLQYLVHLTVVIGHSLQSRGHPAWVLQ